MNKQSYTSWSPLRPQIRRPAGWLQELPKSRRVRTQSSKPPQHYKAWGQELNSKHDLYLEEKEFVSLVFVLKCERGAQSLHSTTKREVKSSIHCEEKGFREKWQPCVAVRRWANEGYGARKTRRSHFLSEIALVRLVNQRWKLLNMIFILRKRNLSAWYLC